MILVTGATGFIGTHLVERLSAERHPVCSLVHTRPPAHHIPGTQVRYADLRDSAAILDAMRDVTIAIHLGGLASAGVARLAPAEAFQVNTAGTQNVLEAARIMRVQRVVLLSTAHVYGAPSELPVTEDTPIAPASIYAATKYAADVLAMSYASCFALPVTILRPFNVYGPGQGTDAIIPTIISQAINGGPIRVRNTAPRRDFVFVSDVVDALIKAALNPAATGATCILASGHPVSVGWLVTQVAALTGISLASAPDAQDDTTDCVFGSPARAHRLLGWTPATTLQAGLSQTIEWWRATAR